MSEDVGKGQSGQAAGLVEATRRVTLAGWSKLLEGNSGSRRIGSCRTALLRVKSDPSYTILWQNASVHHACIRSHAYVGHAS